MNKTFNFRVYYDADWEWKWDFWNSYNDYFYCQIKTEFKITGSVSLTGKLQHDFELGEIDCTTPIGVIIAIPVKLHVEVSLSITISIDAIKMTIGFKYDEDSGFINLCEGPKISINPKLQGKAELKIGLKLGIEISFLKIIAITIEPQFGGKVTLKTDEISGEQLLNLKSVDSIHACNFFNCFNGDLSFYATVSVKGKILIWEVECPIVPEYTQKISDCHLKISPFEFQLCKCPNIAYRCDITVVNSNDEPIKNVQINSNGPDLGDNYKFNVTNATDNDGKVSFFYPKGSYTPDFYLNGQKVDVTKLRTKIFNSETSGCTFRVADTTKTIKIKIDTATTEGGGNGHNGGGGSTDWFMCTATFDANGGKFSDGTTKKKLEVRSNEAITTPSEPSKNNYYFDCWYYKDSKGKEIEMPEKMPGKDTTFYARWSTTPVTGHSDGTGSNDGWADSTHLYFGSYPQTDVTSSMGATLNPKATGWKSYNYYSGTGTWSDGKMTPSDYMMYCDVKYGNNKYRGVKFSSYRPYLTGFTSSSNEQQDNGYHTNTTYWFRYEPIKWRVLDSSTGLVMCESIIDSQPFNNYILNADGKYWGDANKTYYASNYSRSSLRDWLTKDFYATAFSETQQGKMLAYECDNSCYISSYSQYDSVPLKTNDKVFLLSYDDSINSKYGFSSDYSDCDPARRAQGTDYAKCQGLWVFTPTDSAYNGNSGWWLRSPSYDCDIARGVDGDGYSGSSSYVDSAIIGVRPALKLNLKSLGTNSSLETEAAEGAVSCNYNSAGEAGGEYILLNVTGYGSGFTLTTGNLEFIDEVVADESGKISGSFIPRNYYTGSTTLLIGDFGKGIEAKKLTVSSSADNPDEPDVIPDIVIKNYKPSLEADYKSTVTFTVSSAVPEGYKVVWSTGQEGTTCTLTKVTDKSYKISAKLVKKSDNSTAKISSEITVTVKTGFFRKLKAFFRSIFGKLPVYVDFMKK